MRLLRPDSPREWVLRLSTGQELYLRLVPGACATVGRDLTCELPILDAGISRHHATFTLDGEDLWLDDLHSQNGSYVNTERVHHTRILSGDVITLGRVSLTINARPFGGEEEDPLQRLDPQRLTQLLCLSRDLTSEKEGPAFFQKLVSLTLEGLPADRGIIFLFEENRDHFHPVAAFPHEAFHDAAKVLSAALARSVLEGTRARALPGAAPPAAASAVACPLRAGERPLGVFYVSRCPSRPAFQASDVDFLSAIAWSTGPALGAFTQARGTRASGKAEFSAPEASRASLPPGRFDDSSLPGRDCAALETDPSLHLPGNAARSHRATLEDVERGLLAASDEVARSAALVSAKGAALAPEPLDVAAIALLLARLAVEGTRRLDERHPERFEEVAVDRVLSQLQAVDARRREYSIQAGEPLSVFCDPEDLVLAMRLLAEARLGRRCRSTEVTSTSNDETCTVTIRVIAKEPLATASSAEELHGLRDLADRLGAQIIGERLRGEVASEVEPAAFAIELPQPAKSLGETLVLQRK